MAALNQNRSSTQSFQYTRNNSCLTSEQRQFYEKNGFLVIKKLVSPQKLKIYSDRFEAICRKQVEAPGMILMRDVAITTSEFIPGEKAIAKVQDFVHDDVLFEYCCLPEVVDYVECFTGPDITAVHTMFINKPPDTGSKSSRHPMHQDLHYFPFRPADNIVCSWTAIVPVNRQNGCLVVVPGSHTGELLPHEYPDWQNGVNKMYHGIQNYDPDQPRVHLDMEPGDTVFFHPVLIHGSGTNKTKHFRKSISCHYAASDCDYIDISGLSTEQLAEEVTQIARKRVGEDVDISYQDVWRVRSKRVRGREDVPISRL